MSNEHAMTNPHDAPEESFAEGKGKGKAAAQDLHDSRVEDDEDDDDEDEEDDEVEAEAEAEQDDEDGMEEMDLNNVIYGRRTRGRKIDFAKAAEELGPEKDEDEEDEDEDFQPAPEDTEMGE
ncbi:Histone H2A.Z-specific chaperone CHZ1 [Escovopsis weberi]|uniref:Histone H2A.Z-specific chaperone CHZ1 n=1 Tax=Escovopsis weberi TaxID=150374 RepID=A0A0N0RU22_ESCWE|nr:Histone H2A.Z-specific chaperone CHZ1 [Escovopsis weberi]